MIGSGYAAIILRPPPRWLLAALALLAALFASTPSASAATDFASAERAMRAYYSPIFRGLAESAPAPRPTGGPLPSSVAGVPLPKPPPTTQSTPSTYLHAPDGGKDIYLLRFYAERYGALEECNIEEFTSTADPTRRIRYGEALACGDHISGVAATGLGEPALTPHNPTLAPVGLSLNSVFTIHKPGESGGFNYDNTIYERTAEDQLEQIYGYFTLDIDNGQWLTAPDEAYGDGAQIRCRGIYTTRLTCEIISIPFPFIYDDIYECRTGDICQASKGLPATVQAQIASATNYSNQVVANAQDTFARNLVAAQDAAAALAESAADQAAGATYGGTAPAQDVDEAQRDQSRATEETLWDTWATNESAISRANASGANSVRLTTPAGVTKRYTTRSYLPSGLTDAERALCRAHPFSCLTIENSRRFAVASTRNRFSARELAAGQMDGIADAYRHCIWIGSASLQMADDLARQFGEAHEDHGRLPNETRTHYSLAKAMDLHNNNEGILEPFTATTFGRRAFQKANGCEGDARGGVLWHIKPTRNFSAPGQGT